MMLYHPQRWREGVRVLSLIGRNKDGVKKQRMIQRVSHGATEFGHILGEFQLLAGVGERIYASACPRNISAAIRLFKERQLQNDYDADPVRFYQKINTRWVSALMAKQCQENKVWLFDCDSGDDFHIVLTELRDELKIIDPYYYQTKNGHHIIIKPFNKMEISEYSRSLLQENPLMLWGY